MSVKEEKIEYLKGLLRECRDAEKEWGKKRSKFQRELGKASDAFPGIELDVMIDGDGK